MITKVDEDAKLVYLKWDDGKARKNARSFASLQKIRQLPSSGKIRQLPSTPPPVQKCFEWNLSNEMRNLRN